MFVDVVMLCVVLLAVGSHVVGPRYNRWAVKCAWRHRICFDQVQDGSVKLGVGFAVLGVLLFFWSDGVEVSLFRKLAMLAVGVFLVVAGSFREDEKSHPDDD